MNKPNTSYYTLNPLVEYKKVKQIWTELEGNCPHSFFISWIWIQTWLKTLPRSQKVVFVYGVNHKDPFIAYFVGWKNGFINRIIYGKKGFLNSTGNQKQDEITIEYNGVMFNSNASPQDFHTGFLGQVSNWNQLFCPAVDSNLFHAFAIENKTFGHHTIRSAPSYFVDLELVRNEGSDLLPLLSRNKRAQIRKSARHYQSTSKLTIERAENIDCALNTLKALEELHQKHWVQKGQTGAFSSRYFRDFHNRLIRKHFHSNTIDLLIIRSGKAVIGYLYNFVYKNEVLFYQCGFNYQRENNIRPGLLCHYLAINYYANLNIDKYNFLAGDNDYKKSLSTNNAELKWLSLRRKDKHFDLDTSIKKLKRFIRP